MTKKHLTWIALIGFAAALVLHTSMLTRQQEDRLSDLNRQIAAEQERIRVLTAEWHSLKTPERLEQLAKRHLPTYAAVKPVQLASLFDVPDKLAVPAEPALAAAKPTPVTPAKPAQVAAAKPATAKPAAPAKPVQVAAAKPAAAPKPVAAKPVDDVARLITDSNDDDNDGIRTIIERERRPAVKGVLRANFGDLE